MSQIYEIVVEVEEKSGQQSRHGSCSPAPSTSASSSSSGAGSPPTSEAGSRISKKKSSSNWHYLGERRKTRKVKACKVKCAKKLASASKFRLWKIKIDKQHEQKLAAQRANIERLRRERELLLSGHSEIAIMCDTLRDNARSLRATYERQQAVLYQSLISEAIQSQDTFYSHFLY